MSGWEFAEWLAFALAFAGTMLAGWALAELVHRSGRSLLERRRPELYREAGDRWEQVSALEFRLYRATPHRGGRWELEAMIFEDSPAGCLAAKRFAEDNVRGPRIVHTRDVTGR